MNTSSIERSATQPGTNTVSPWKPRTLAIVAAIVVNIVILAIGRIANGRFPTAKVGSDDQAIGFALVIFVTLLVGLVAWGLLNLVTRMSSRPASIWTTIAIIIFLVSLLGPLGSATNTSSRIVLLCLHIGAAVTIIPLMRKSTV